MEIKVKGITRRWLLNVLTVFIGVVCMVEILIAIFIHRYFYNSVKDAALTYSRSFTVLSNCTKSEFPAFAKEFAERFEHKDRLEIQVLDTNGRVIASTSGFLPKEQEMPDYELALKSSSSSATHYGKTPSGEKIMAGTSILPDTGNGSNGAVRWIVSLEAVDRQCGMLVALSIAVGIGVVAFATISGLYFIRSIVHPIQEVSNIARKIAMGDFKARIKVKDTDEIGELCDSINYMASELAHAENMKNEFISSVSHELRTPLTAIKGWGETVKSALDKDPALVNKGLDIILSEADRLSSLVEELLDFSRMQSGRLSMNMKPIDILAELGEAVLMYNEFARQQKIELTYMEPEYLPPVYGDGDRLKQVFINILDNAIKYTNEGGQVLVNAYEEEGCIRITISDTGVGIPAAALDRVKEKFFKANKTVSGSGIGLAVADEIVKQHNGFLFIESKENVGTTVTIVLPIYTGEEDKQESSTPVVDIPPTSVIPKTEELKERENQ
ncbi:MAG TPA: HAMP domain-containing histidine kinase [Clostridiales bacterium]|nr:HAMP domain-containing histidine kinase [Clostridiales bacterium]